MNKNKLYFYTSVAFLSGIAIPVSTALQNITIVAMSIIAIFDKDMRNSLREISKNYFVIFSMLLYIIYLLWAFKSQAPKQDISHMLVKMRVYMLCPLLFAFFRYEKSRVWACYGLVAGAIITLLISFAMYLFNHPMFSATTGGWSCNVGDWAVFRYHTYHNYFLAVMVVGLLTMLVYYGDKLSKIVKLTFGIIIILASIDILYLVQGRAGQILFIMMLVLMFLLWNFKKGMIACIVIAIISFGVLHTSQAAKCGVERYDSDVHNYATGNSDSSFGARIEFHKYALELIKAKPILGYGTGSFHSEYQKYTGFTENRATKHPHNDFYWIWVEFGLFGLFAILAIVLSGVYYGWKAKTPEGNFAIVISLSYAVCALQGGAYTDNISGAAFMVLMSIFLSGRTFSSRVKQ